MAQVCLIPEQPYRAWPSPARVRAAWTASRMWPASGPSPRAVGVL